MSDIPVELRDQGQTRPSSADTVARPRYAKARRTNRACDACAKVKMRCDTGPSNNPPCARCSRQGYDCTFAMAAAREGKKSKAGSAASELSGEPIIEGSTHRVANGPQARPMDPVSATSAAPPSTVQELLKSHAVIPSLDPTDLSPASRQWCSDSRSAGHDGTLPISSTDRHEHAGASYLPDIHTHGRSNSTSLFANADASCYRPTEPAQQANLDPGSTPSASSSTVRMDVKRLVDPLGLLVFASLDVPNAVTIGQPLSDAQQGNALHVPSDSSTSLSTGGDRSSAEEEDAPGMKPHDIYFRPLRSQFTLKHRKRLPEVYKILTKEQIQELFEIFYENFHVHAPIIDRDHGTPDQIAGRSHFLLHAICAVAMRSWKGPADKHQAMLALISTFLRRLPKERTLECVQANLLCATWNPVSPQHSDLDEQYLRVGLATRLAMDLGLHNTVLPAQEGIPEWVLRSQLRTWAFCFIFESKLSTHRHQDCYIPIDGLRNLARNGTPDDLRMLSSVEWCQIIARIRSPMPAQPSGNDSVGNQQSTSTLQKCDEIDKELLEWKDRWIADSSKVTRNLQVLLARIRLYYHYAQIVNYAHALQSVCEEPNWTESLYATRYLDAVVRMLYTFIEDFGAHRSAAYLSDLHFTYTAFSAVSLIHSLTMQLGPKSYQSTSSVNLVIKVADLFEACAGTYGHNLRNQSYFLRAVLRAKLTEDGKPTAVPLTDVNLSHFDFDESLFLPMALPQEAETDLWGFAVPVSHETDSMNAFLNSNSILSNAHFFDSAYWDSMMKSSLRQNGTSAENFLHDFT